VFGREHTGRVGARFALAVAACALALSGCGGDDEETTTSTTTTTTGTTGATGATGDEGTETAGGVPTAKEVTACASKIEGAKASDVDGDIDVSVPALELDAGVPPTGGAPATGETRIEFHASFINLVFFEDSAEAEDAIKLVEEEEDTKAEEGRLGSTGTVLYYVTFENLKPDELAAVNDCLTEAGGEPIPAA
jgi:hypothetical protein